MRFTVIGHACLYIETGSQRILVDPWLSGSCYWRSWWHFPPNTPIRQEFLEPDYVYLTHHHFDHFHYPSLRRISKQARVLIPRFGVDVMRAEVGHLGFTDIVEMPHGEPMTLPGGARVASYQYGPDDSAFVVERNGVVLADLNDCKIKGPAAGPLLKMFGRPTFVFKSHSFAQAYPSCYTINDPADAKLMTREDFLETFIDALRELRPQYAVPFASMVAFLHPESRHSNQWAVRPPEVAAFANSADVATTTTTVLMVPGDTWSSDQSFALQPNDYYEHQDEWIERLVQASAPKLRQEEDEEREIALTFEHFAAHFGHFVRSLPPLSWVMLKRPMVFYAPSDSAAPYWILNFRQRTVTRAATPPAHYAAIVTLREAVLADAIAKNVVAFAHISMRIKIDLAPGGIQTDFLFWGLLSIHELGYFPLRRMATPRAVAVLWRRRAEVWGVLRSMLNFKSWDEKVRANLASRHTGSA